MNPEDIRKGDKIRVERGSDLLTVEGVAHVRYDRGVPGFYWVTKSDDIVYTTYWEDAKVVLLNRAKPTEPKAVGTVIRATVSDFNRVLVYVRLPGNFAYPWTPGAGGPNRMWAELKNVEILHEGWNGDS